MLINVRTTAFNPETDVYIGRSCGKFKSSIWANKYRLKGKCTPEERARVIQKYENDLLNNHRLMERLPELKGKRLACWCHPEPCHGDVLLKYLAEL